MVRCKNLPDTLHPNQKASPNQGKRDDDPGKRFGFAVTVRMVFISGQRGNSQSRPDDH